MKILFLSSLNPEDIKSWSGTLYYIYQNLKKNNIVEWMGREILESARNNYRIKNGSQSQFVPEDNASLIGDLCSKEINDNVSYDIIVARDYYLISDLKTDIPVVYIGDTTFNLFKDYIGAFGYFEEIADKVEKKAILNSDLIIYSSIWAKNDAITHYDADPNKIKILEFGANIEDLYIPKNITFPASDCCNLVFIGRDWVKKGGQKAYDTYRWLNNLGLNTSLTIIGCSPPNLFDVPDSKLRVISNLDKSKKSDIELLDSILRTSHFLILPTVFDCFGIVFCEASAYGIPSIASDVGGVHQVVVNDKNGYILPEHANSTEYGQLIFDTFKNTERYNNLRLSSRNEFETRLNWNTWENKMNNFLKNVVTQKEKMKNIKHEFDFYIPTFVINLKERKERRDHIISEFNGKSEFKMQIIDACTHEVGAVGLWNSIVKIIQEAIDKDEDVIIICEDDHYFTEHYSPKYLFDNILLAHEQGADILSGGIGGFGYAVPVAKNRYWIDWLWCTQFIVVYKEMFQKILDYEFKYNDTADGVISLLSNNIMTLYPFISRQKAFGYSDITQSNKDNPNLINEHFERSDSQLLSIHKVSTFYNYSHNLGK